MTPPVEWVSLQRFWAILTDICQLWDIESGQCIYVFSGHLHQIYAVAFDGQRVATGSLDSTVRIWSAKTG
jgi:F-box and WD-40 domain protein CDC4